MAPKRVNDKADAALTPEQDDEVMQPAEGDGVPEPVSDADGEAAEADPTAVDQAVVSCAEESNTAADLAGEVEPPPVDEAMAAVPAEAPAAAVDRTTEILATLSRYQAAREAEQAASQEQTDQLLRGLSDLAGKVALLSSSTAAMTVTIQKMAGETEQLTNWSDDVRAAGSWSKQFQIVMLLALVLVLTGMSFLAVRQYQANRHLSTAEATIAAAIKVQQQQIAGYDKHFANLVGVEIAKEREASFKNSVQEKINRLRNGAAEQQLYRKSNGDWFAVLGKNEVALSDPDCIEELNQAFTKAGRPLKTTYLVPPHKVVVILRANGKGGTEIVVTKEVAS